VFGQFDEARAGFLRRLVATGKTGRTWTTLAPDDAAATLAEERSRILAALEYLDEKGLIELQPADVRQRYTVLAHPDSDPELVERLLERFARRERAETDRIQSVLALVGHDDCQVSALVGYFGETRTEPCGHCSHCLTGSPQQLPEPDPKPPIQTSLDVDELAAITDSHPGALGTPRQQARFLAGITSPATTRAKLTRDRLFGSLAERRFADILAWCESQIG
jgi:ATP-dependent DNA helicase RecQ